MWVRIGFDGVPYRIANEIITNIVTCSICDCKFLINSYFEEHSANSHQSNASSKKSFGNILLAAGAGQNLLSIFKLCKDMFLGWLAYILGFRSLKAK